MVEGDDFELFARIRNIGNVAADAGFFANQEAVFFFDGVQQGEGDDYDNLAPGASIVVSSGSLTAPTGGDYAIRVVADGNNEVLENNEANNEATGTLSVISKLSWRQSELPAAAIVEAEAAGAIVYAHIYDPASPGASVEVEIWEDDTPGTSQSADDRVATLSVALDSQGFGVASWMAAWQGLDAAAPLNRYYLYYDDFRSAPLAISVAATLDSHVHTTPMVYDWGTSPPGEGVIDVTLERRGGLPIDALAPHTWLVIHGRNDSGAAFEPLADTVRAASYDQQVLTLNWSEGASSVFAGDFSGESWIAPVATWVVATLIDYGFVPEGLNVIGHSWGGVLTGELAARFPGGVHRVVALDPAEDAPPPFGTSYSTEGVHFGLGHSQYSWAFYSRDGATLGITAGSEETPTTAHEAYVVTDSGHSEVVDLFMAMIASPVEVASRFFSLDRLIAGVPGPWLSDQYDDEGVLSGEGLYEGVIGSTSGGTQATDILFVGNGTPVTAPGDYDANDQVDGRDFLRWQREVGQTGAGLAADGNFDQVVGRADLRIFQAHFGTASGTQAAGTASLLQAEQQPDLVALAMALDQRSMVQRRPPRSDDGALDLALSTYMRPEEELATLLAEAAEPSAASLSPRDHHGKVLERSEHLISLEGATQPASMTSRLARGALR